MFGPNVIFFRSGPMGGCSAGGDFEFKSLCIFQFSSQFLDSQPENCSTWMDFGSSRVGSSLGL